MKDIIFRLGESIRRSTVIGVHSLLRRNVPRDRLALAVYLAMTNEVAIKQPHYTVNLLSLPILVQFNDYLNYESVSVEDYQEVKHHLEAIRDKLTYNERQLYTKLLIEHQIKEMGHVHS